MKYVLLCLFIPYFSLGCVKADAREHHSRTLSWRPDAVCDNGYLVYRKRGRKWRVIAAVSEPTYTIAKIPSGRSFWTVGGICDDGSVALRIGEGVWLERGARVVIIPEEEVGKTYP